MSNDTEPLYIDGQRVTVGNARRFVQARRPTAEATRERHAGWLRRGHYTVVRDRTPGAPWCYATADTAGEAWLKVARAMVEHDAGVAEQKRRLDAVRASLYTAVLSGDIESAALRYAAERILQSDVGWRDQRQVWSDALLEMAAQSRKEKP